MGEAHAHAMEGGAAVRRAPQGAARFVARAV